jgi:hypothetical protein
MNKEAFEKLISKRSMDDFTSLIADLPTDRIDNPKRFFSLIKTLGKVDKKTVVAIGYTTPEGEVKTEDYLFKVKEYLEKFYWDARENDNNKNIVKKLAHLQSSELLFDSPENLKTGVRKLGSNKAVGVDMLSD